ncbi:hypothetical protein AB1Y20_000673 [Prymnesium parvum]|uniref:Solute carrier family 40 protein n=1 Tax=Prymnesium parvum TaxID=97485 RepID=A0AB34K8T8_PRYPA
MQSDHYGVEKKRLKPSPSAGGGATAKATIDPPREEEGGTAPARCECRRHGSETPPEVAPLMRVSDDGRMFSPLTEAMDERQALPQLTVRAVVAGLLVGSMHCFINVYFGLQTGWVTMGSIQCAVVGYALFQLPMLRSATRFNSLENVVLQTVGVATATMPLAGGFVGIIPALGMLDPPVVLSVWQQVVWAAGLTYFGIFFAVPLRRQTILVEQLTFPSGTATAKLIETLHAKHERISGYGPTELDTSRRWRILSCAFVSSFLVAAIGFVFPFLANIDVGAVVGRPSLAAWHWTLRPSLSYIGQGMIMRQRPAFSMLGGALTAWAVLGPMARRNGWATGDIDSWEDGVQGWVLWVAMGLLLAEALTSFSLILLQQVSNTVVKYSRSLPSGPTDDLDPAPLKEQVPTAWWAGGLLASIVLRSVG